MGAGLGLGNTSASLIDFGSNRTEQCPTHSWTEVKSMIKLCRADPRILNKLDWNSQD